MTNAKPARKTRVPAKPSKTAAVKPRSPAVAKKSAASGSKVPKPAAPAAPAAKVKNKLVRDSFTIPKSEYAVLAGLKLRAANLKRPAKKSELLRAGVGALNAMSDKAFLLALNAVPSLKTGRPKGVAVPAQALPRPDDSH